jgi:hypothetical protein
MANSPPLRTTTQFCSFFASLPQVMDGNFPIGNLLITNIVLILHKSPFPPRYAANWQPTFSILQENLIYHGCSYTLWHLEPCLRKQWLEAMLVLVYKYNFSEPENLSDKVIGLVRIIINSLAAHVHMCSKFCKAELQMRSQELSEASNGNLGTATLQVPACASAVLPLPLPCPCPCPSLCLAPAPAPAPDLSCLSLLTMPDAHTVQGSEDNTACNSRASPTSAKRTEEGNSDGSDKAEEEAVSQEGKDVRSDAKVKRRSAIISKRKGISRRIR